MWAKGGHIWCAKASVTVVLNAPSHIAAKNGFCRLNPFLLHHIEPEIEHQCLGEKHNH